MPETTTPDKHRILFEPFKIKVVEPLPTSTESERAEWISSVGYNVFGLTSEQVMLDLLTDSGTAAMSDAQWAAMIRGDEAYAGSRSFLELEATARELTGMEHIIPVHQGRAAEHNLFSVILKQGSVVPANALFDTTHANVQLAGGSGINLGVPESADPFLNYPFKGNLDCERLEELLKEQTEKIACVVVTITNNNCGGQPVSIENLSKVRELTKRFGKMLVLDACRFAENAYFVKKREKSSQYDLGSMSATEIAKLSFSFADVITFSGKKDALSNIGGLLCVRSTELADKIKNHLIVTEGFPTYGGLAGYSLAAMNQGLKEVLDERYLAYRLRTVEWICERLLKYGVPVLMPPGGHAVYIEASRFFPHIPRHNFPGIALTTELYIQGGIRGCELGGVAFGYRKADGTQVFPALDLVRLALPRRVYTEAHMGYVVECLAEIYSKRESVRGFEFLEERPVMRHFLSKFRRL